MEEIPANKPVESPKGKMTPETRRVIVEALDQAFRSIGFPALDEASETLRKVLGKGLPEMDPEAGFSSATMLTLLDYIDNSPEPTPEELRESLEKLKTFPYEFRATLDKTFKSIKRSLPHKPGGGRPSSLDLEEKKDACLRVGTLIAQGVSLSDAFKHVGQHFGVGARTIQRAWQQRAALHKSVIENQIPR